MTTNYHQWLECTIEHGYFDQGVGSIFRWIPLLDTAKRMRNYEILPRANRNALHFYIGIRESDAFDVQSSLEGITDLVFQLVVDDPLFLNYTDLAQPEQGQLLFFSNKDKSNGDAMHSGELVSEENNINVAYRGLEHSVPSGSVKVEIKNEEGAVVHESEHNNDQETLHVISLQNQPSGMYELWENDALVQQFYLLQESLQQGCIGLVHLHIPSLQNGYEEGQSYTITFGSRSVIREYKVILPNANTTLELSIEGTDGATYTGPVEEAFMTNQIAQVFTGDKAFPMRQLVENPPTLHYSYSSDVTDRDSIELKLPIPGPETLRKKTNEENEQSFYSTSIIYV
ncbi:MAG: hypothetical protein AAF466_01680 [Bacteroidota bacterium]